MTRKNRLEIQLRTYLVRRKALKRKFPEGGPVYTARRKRMQIKIDRLRRQIKAYAQARAQLRAIDDRVKAFTGYAARDKRQHTAKNTNTAQELAVKFFIKSAYDAGIDSRHIIEYMRYKDRHTTSDSRRAFVKSFKTNPENFKLWQDFKQYLQHENSR